jgi:hypothetical protein
MHVSKLRLTALAVVSGLALGGCAYGYDGYGSYGGVGVGVGYGYGNYGYGYPYGGYGYGYGDPYGYGGFGWYDGFYYPGSGIYVYDRHRHRHVWTDTQRRHWFDRSTRTGDASGATATPTGTTTATVAPRENWSGFDRRNRGSDARTTTPTSGSDRGHWGRGRESSTRSSSDTTTDRPSGFWRGRGHGSKND